nr:hypothetical protein [Tanacetum cinerariifolium]
RGQAEENEDKDDGAEADMNNLNTAIQEELLQFKLQEVWTLMDLPYRKRAIGTKWVFKNKKDERGIVIRNRERLVAQGHTQEEGIDYDEIFTPVTRIKAIRLFLAYASFKDFMVYQMDIEEEVYVYQPLGFEDPDFLDKVGNIDKTLFIIRHKDDILLVQVYVDDIIFGSTKKELCNAFEEMMYEKFQMKDKNASTPMETQKPLLKDEDGEEVDVYMYRLMIGSLMYLTSSRPNIMFKVCAYARYQVNPKVSHLHVVKRISAYTNSDYAEASLDRKSTTGGCQYMRCQEAMGDAVTQTRSERVSKVSNDPLLVGVNTPRNARVESSEDEGLGEEDSSKQGRIADIDANEDIYLVNDHNDEDMFGVNDLDGDEVIVESEDAAEQAKEVVDDITLAKALVEIKSANPKADKVMIQEPEQVSSQQPSQVKDKGKGKMVEPEPVKKFSKKYQLMLDEELASKLQVEEEEMIAKLFMEFLEKRRKFFAAKRAKEKRNRPPTKAQQRSIMSTYLKNMDGWKIKSLKKKSFDEIQELFDKAMKKVNTFIDCRTKLAKESSKKAKEEITQEGSLKSG